MKSVRLAVAGWAAVLGLLPQGALPQSATSTAVIVASEGETRLVRPSALFSPLRTGLQVRAGDKLVTGPDGRVELRFADNALVSLNPDTEFRIEEYRYDGEEQC